MSVTKIRHPSLSSTSARRALGHRTEPVFSELHRTIDVLASLHDALAGVRANQSPLQTPEANAIAYRQKYEAATKRAGELVQAQIARLASWQIEREDAALKTAGLDRQPADAAEIRAALRAMSQKDRDQAISAAIERGEAGTIASVMAASPIVTGQITTPVATLTKLFLDKQVPSLAGDLKDIEAAFMSLRLASDAFESAAADLRDPAAEQRAVAGDLAAQAAARALGAAMAGQGAAPIDTGGRLEAYDAAQGNVVNLTETSAA